MPKIRLFSTALVLVLVLSALTTAGQAQTFSVLYNFGANDRDATHPGTPGVLTQETRRALLLGGSRRILSFAGWLRFLSCFLR
jgi:hypothetical protein